MSRLSRWSRRKLGVDADEEVLAEPPAALNDQVDRASAPEPEPGSLDATLPDPDTLPSGSDFKAFLQAGVSDALRRRALRRMFTGDHYGIRDGLDDYDDDYRQKLKPLANELAQRLRQWTHRVEESQPEVHAEESTEPSIVDTAEETDIAAPQAEDESVAGQETSVPRKTLDPG
ncbi:MAG: DUF3306 domain-containing protein [Halomonas sp.]|nr:DUF3306 domain-containing protein [Halomonas sp.]